jgi:hypothetical protein
MLNRAKRIAADLTRQLARPIVVASVPHELRGALADLSAELIEINQRLDTLERNAAAALIVLNDRLDPIERKLNGED